MNRLGTRIGPRHIDRWLALNKQHGCHSEEQRDEAPDRSATRCERKPCARDRYGGLAAARDDSLDWFVGILSTR